jgi:5-formyltetrahydrofolate cyclo-ligase
MNKTRPPISDKYIVRANVKQRISLLSEEEKNEASQLLCEKLLKLVIIQEAQNLIYYQAMGDEISLTPFIAVAQKE